MESSASRLERIRRTAAQLVAKAGDRVRGTRSALALTLLSLTDPEVFVTYTSAPRSADHYEAWLADVLCRTVLD